MVKQIFHVVQVLQVYMVNPVKQVIPGIQQLSIAKYLYVLIDEKLLKFTK